jgi:hypothetical protein
MSNRIHRHLLSLGGATLLAFAATSAMADNGAAAYSCNAQGDQTACASVSAARADAVTQLVPGSYARYLINMGYTVDQAIAQARTIGEQPTLQVVNGDAQRLSSFESYERLQGLGRF